MEVPRPPCPRCSGPTIRWSGYERHLRADGDHLIHIPRVRCRECGGTQALLPWFVVPKRWDAAEVIGAALGMASGGMGYRRIARVLERPETTVRDWGRRLRTVAISMGAGLLETAVDWGWSGLELPVSPLPRWLAAVEAAVERWRVRQGPARRWRVVNLITGGLFGSANMHPPLAAGSGSAWMAAKSTEEVPDGP